MTLNSIEEIIAEIRAGRMVVMMDDEDRENEGDLIMAAASVRPEDVNFMARYGRGLICLTLTRERCRQLRLPLMVNDTDAKHLTNFTVSIEAARGVTTGISAADRAATIQAAVAPGAGPEDLVQPGHIFPLMAQPGGVLRRAGHTEASVDLALMADFQPVAVMSTIFDENGELASTPYLLDFAHRHGFKITTIKDLIAYRHRTEKLIRLEARTVMPTRHGEFT
ncbi:MAG: 3,4-dihydroxy-2-butanone-4-phosphate synthase, partial [Gammaproteobacteria bacterium]